MNLITKTAIQIKDRIGEIEGAKLAEDLEKMLNTWHSLPEIYDEQIENYILQTKLLYTNIRNQNGNYYRSSYADACKRSLYHMRLGDKRDRVQHQPHQGRWTRIGTAVGDIIQRDLLYIAKHYKRQTGEEPKFKPVFIENPQPNSFGITELPMWEEFAAKETTVHHKGHTIPLKGQPDGILETQDGKKIGLEIKTKQTTYSRTGAFSMREPETKHVKQVIGYSLLYGVDEFIILYINTSKFAWNLDDDKMRKYPDIRAFHVSINDEDVESLLDYFVEVEEAIKLHQPPPIDWDKWTFNNYKEAIAQSMTPEEIEELEFELDQAKRELEIFEPSGKKKNPPYKLRSRVETLQSAYDFVREVITSKS